MVEQTFSLTLCSVPKLINQWDAVCFTDESQT